MNEKLSLFVDCCDGFVLDLNESASNKGYTKFRGKFQEAEAINKNKRIYPYDILDENVKKLKPIIEARGLVGELDHPTDSIVHFEKCSHLITKLWWDGNALMGEGEILNTPQGRILKSLIEQGVRVGISSRGVGNGRSDENGVLVIGESYKLITFDAVVDPSTNEAFQKEYVAGKKESFEPAKSYERTVIKEEQSRKISKESLIAWAGGVIETQKSTFLRKLS